jgi:hypothetical protein
MLLGNLSILVKDNVDIKTQCIAICGELLSVVKNDVDMANLLSAMGTLMLSDSNIKGIVNDLDLVPKLHAIANGAFSEGVKQRSRYCISMASQMDTSN